MKESEKCLNVTCALFLNSNWIETFLQMIETNAKYAKACLINENWLDLKLISHLSIAINSTFRLKCRVDHGIDRLTNSYVQRVQGISWLFSWYTAVATKIRTHLSVVIGVISFKLLHLWHLIDQSVHLPNIAYMSFLSSGIFAKRSLSKLLHSLWLAYFYKKFHVKI